MSLIHVLHKSSKLDHVASMQFDESITEAQNLDIAFVTINNAIGPWVKNKKITAYSKRWLRSTRINDLIVIERNGDWNLWEINEMGYLFKSDDSFIVIPRWFRSNKKILVSDIIKELEDKVISLHKF